MGTTLSNGVYLPDEGERNCYAGLKVNWEILNQKVADISALQLAIAGALHREIVESLPTTDIDPNTIYMVLSGTSATENVYNEFMYVNNAWELIGTSATDLTNYYTKGEVDSKLLLKASASDLTSHTGDTTIHVTANDKARWNTVALIKQLRLVNAQVGSATTIAFSDIDDTNGIKVGDKCMDLDAKIFEISAVDTANETVSVTTPLTQLAVDSSVIHKTGNETKSGELTLNDTLNTSNIIPNSNNTYDYGTVSNLLKNLYTYHAFFRGQQQRDEYSNNARTNLTLLANRDTIGSSGILFDTFRENTPQGTGSHILGFGIKENSIRYEGCRFSWYYDNNNNGYFFVLKPTTQGTNQPIKYELGDSTSKWTTVNGLEPSALGMPDLDNGVDISSYLDTSQSSINYYTPPVNGWISIKGRSSTASGIGIIQGDMAQMGYALVDFDSSNRVNFCVLPVKAGVQVEIWLKSVTTLDSAKFIPCLGNV